MTHQEPVIRLFTEGAVGDVHGARVYVLAFVMEAHISSTCCNGGVRYYTFDDF